MYFNNYYFNKLWPRKAAPVKRSKTRETIVEAATSHIKFRSRKIEK